MKRVNLFFAALALFFGASAQDEPDRISADELNAITTAVPFLRIAPDARSGAMGDVGVALSPDPNSIAYNSARYAFAEEDFAIGVSYTPWLRALGIDDIYLAYLAGYKKIDDDQAIGAGLRYFSLGDIIFTDRNGAETGQFRPHEFSFTGTYSRKLSDVLSTALALKFIYSNLATGFQVNSQTIEPGTAIAADISTYYEKGIRISDKDATLRFGGAISNIGNKITYTQSANKDFIPINLALGSSLTMAFDDYNEMTFALDFNKLLVPTPDSTGLRNDIPVIEGMFTSFADAPGGFKEEIHEIMYSAGIEYWYDQQFAVRGGYFYEHPTKGDRQYATLGVGLRYQVFNINVAYLFTTNGQQNPLDNTLRFSLLFDFAALTGADTEAE